MLKQLLLVGTGGFIGSILRYAVGRALSSITLLSLPWGTLAVNVAGCFLIGLLCGLKTPLSVEARLILVTGLCGGFTTFSTFMNDNLTLADGGQWLTALLYTAASMLLGAIAVWGGYALVR